jgi:hypothetical protein
LVARQPDDRLPPQQSKTVLHGGLLGDSTEALGGNLVRSFRDGLRNRGLWQAKL